MVLPGPAGLLLAALLLDASSSSPYIHQNGQHLQQVTLACYLHAAGCTTAGHFILIALQAWEWSALATRYLRATFHALCAIAGCNTASALTS